MYGDEEAREPGDDTEAEWGLWLVSPGQYSPLIGPDMTFIASYATWYSGSLKAKENKQIQEQVILFSCSVQYLTPSVKSIIYIFSSDSELKKG